MSPSPANAAWHASAIFYEVPVRSFFDANGDGTGDFQGLTQKLDYIQELGATCIWLLPFMQSPLRDDGYDVSDYRAVHPAYGNISDFQKFLKAAHDRGLRVAAEMTINHTSDQHPWFAAARLAGGNDVERHYYHWSQSGDRFAKADILFRDSHASNWSWDAQAKAFYWHRFYPHQPDLNYDHPEVRQEMLKVLRFWADQGVDALCLNGAAYLTEQEETTCEHLPQTHELLRSFRAELSSSYPHLVLQAGVNAPVAKSAEYFGAGNECHLVPQSALAERLFLALRQEQARPLESLLEQAPHPPGNCQWITLLRNHDELALSLMSVEEREFMLQEYAHDSVMRRHAGIARRLAPLLHNSHASISLAMGLLLSLPGAPLIYYGDEIGMGDNVFLPGRSGIRTPMQWTSDRNAGFSSADPARLYLPPVDDPVFGFHAVNVQTQLRDSSSRFHHVRRLINLRKTSAALSGGTLQLIASQNNKVLAFVRRSPQETVLAVANLSRTPQQTQLDLAPFAGLIPVELLGRTPFTAIGNAPYSVMLAEHGMLWFRLQTSYETIAQRRLPVAVASVAEIPTIALARHEELFQGAALQTLEREILPGFLKSQRWFGGKARPLESVRVVDWGPLPTEACRAYMTLIESLFTDGTRSTYFLPIGFAEGHDAATLMHERRSHILARVDIEGRDAIAFDALAHEAIATELLSLMEKGAHFATQSGEVQLLPTGAFTSLRGDSETRLRAVLGPPTSSNSLLFYGRRLLLKLFRRLEPGINPDIEIGRFLTEVSKFDRIPQVAGSLEYRPREGSAPLMLGILQALVPNQGDGWQHAIEELARYYDRASARMFGPDAIEPDTRSLPVLAEAAPPLTALETIGPYLHSAGLLGRRTAEMHLAIAANHEDADFAPSPFTQEDVQALRDDVQQQANQALATLRNNIDHVNQDLAAQAKRLVEEGPAALGRLANSLPPTLSAVKTRIHGDYHLGQVLWVDNDYILLDFEGEPARSVAERRHKFSPVRDVAGMLRSYHYAAYAGLFSFTADRPQDFARLTPWAEVWHQWVSASFLRAYLRTIGSSQLIPQDTPAFTALLETLMLSKAFYELSYELNNRPDWVRIPLGGVMALLDLNLSTSLETAGETS